MLLAAGVIGGAMVFVPIVGIFMLGWSWHQSNESIAPPARSADGKFVLQAEIAHSFTDTARNEHVTFKVRDAGGLLLDEHLTDAIPDARWSIAWDAQDRVWVSSEATGGHAWQREADGKWHELTDQQVGALQSPMSE